MKQVTAALIVDESRVLIAQRDGADALAGLWEFPGGKIEDGETAEECLRRELQEELAVETIIGQFFDSSIFRGPGGAIELLCYWAKIVGGSPSPRVHRAIRWVSLPELAEFPFAPADQPVVERLLRELPNPAF